MNKSPWNYYGRGPVRPAIQARAVAHDPEFGQALPVANQQEKLAAYLQSALTEYSRIRSGPGGYRKLIEAVLKRPARRETIQDTLVRLAGTQPPSGDQDPAF